MKMISAILVDDEENNLSSLTEKLNRYCPQVNIVGKANNGREGKEMIEHHKPDLVFLDIEMPIMNGFILLQQLNFRDFELIFVTAYDHYAIKAIKFSALDYLVKPVEKDELKAAVLKAEENRHQHSSRLQLELLLEQLHKKYPKRIGIPTTEGLQFINIQDIVFLEGSNNYTNIYTYSNQKTVVSRTLKDFEEMLPEESFLRIHHSHIINKNFVEKYIRGEGGQVVMKNGVVLDIAKRKKSEFLQAIGY